MIWYARERLDIEDRAEVPRDCVCSQRRVLGARWVLVPSLHVFFLLAPQFFKEKMKEEILVICS